MDKIKDHLLNVINDNEVLARIFVVIFFFENYTLILDNRSLLSSAFRFDSLSLKPIIFFFAFIALGKALWFVWHFLLTLLRMKLNLHASWDEGVDKKVSVLAFLLCVLLLTYLGIISNNDPLAPVSHTTHPFWNKLFVAVIAIPLLICSLISFQAVNHNEERK
jgi:hypothetical protein